MFEAELFAESSEAAVYTDRESSRLEKVLRIIHR